MLKELLENENKYYKDLCKQQENEIERLNNECDSYMKIATQKQIKIDKAIEYIENSTWEDEYGGDIIEDYDHKLLDILKEDK